MMLTFELKVKEIFIPKFAEVQQEKCSITIGSSRKDLLQVKDGFEKSNATCQLEGMWDCHPD